MSRYYLLFIVFAVLVAGCQSRVEKADKAMATGDYRKAASLYEEVLEKKKMKAPEMAEVRFKLGRAYDKLQRFEGAVEQYRLAIDLKPDQTKYYLAMADDLDIIGLIDEESRVLKNAKTLESSNPHVRAMLGTAYAKLGQLTYAQREFEDALSLNPRDPQNHVNMGLINDKLGDADKAIANWEEAVKLDPKNAVALQNLGAVHTRLSKHGDAVKAYARLVETDRGNAKYHNSLGVAHYNNTEYAEALKDFQKVAELDAGFPGVEDSIRLAERGVKELGGKKTARR